MTVAPTNEIIGRFQDLYTQRFGIKPIIDGGKCGKLIQRLSKDHSSEGLQRIIELYFEDSVNERFSYDLPTILASWSLNKYLPKIKYNNMLYDNAEELNKKIY